MIRTLRVFFLGRLLREKLLLLAFLLFAAAWWGVAFSRRATAFTRDQAATTRQLKQQKTYLDQAKQVEEFAQKAAKSLEPGLTLDGTRLFATVNQAAAEAGLKGSRTTAAGGGGRQSSGQFTVHTVQFAVNGAALDAVEKFYNSIQKRAPYLSIESFQLQADQRTPSQFALQATISSVEIAR